MDLIYVLAIAVLFLLMVGFAAGCERLGSRK